jgi:flavodoxin
MAKSVVLYNSKGGNTKKVAEKIAEGLEADIFDNKNIPDLSEYNLVVVGSWMMAGMISFGGSRYLKKLKKKGIEGKKIAMFYTGGEPEDVHWKDKEQGVENPRKLHEIMFEKMETILSKHKEVTILDERFYCKGAVRMGGDIKSNEGCPTEEDLEKAKQYGIKLKELLK